MQSSVKEELRNIALKGLKTLAVKEEMMYWQVGGARVIIHTYMQYVQEVVIHPKIMNQTILSNRVHVTKNYFPL